LRIIGLTPVGRATVDALHLADDPDALTVRSYWKLVGWHPPRDALTPEENRPTPGDQGGAAAAPQK
jgi:hypothetical protein